MARLLDIRQNQMVIILLTHVENSFILGNLSGYLQADLSNGGIATSHYVLYSYAFAFPDTFRSMLLLFRFCKYLNLVSFFQINNMRIYILPVHVNKMLLVCRRLAINYMCCIVRDYTYVSSNMVNRYAQITILTGPELYFTVTEPFEFDNWLS